MFNGWIFRFTVWKKYKIIDKKNRSHFNDVIALFVTSLSDFLSIIPFIIKKHLSKNKNRNENLIKNENDNQSKNDNYYIYYNKAEDEKKKKMKTLNFYTFLSGFLDFLVKTLTFLYYLINDDDFNESYDKLFSCALAFQIVLQYILSIFILKTHFYRHHYLSILINIIDFFILFVLDNIDDNFDYSYDFAYLGLLTLVVMENAFGKKAMIFGYISPYTLLLLIGIYKNILMFIFLVLFIPIMLSLDDNFFNDMKNYDYIKIIILFGKIIFHFLRSLFNWILVDRFSPSHLALSLILEFISYNITLMAFGFAGEIDTIQISLRLILYLILFLAAMFHNEIFIITKCGLGDNTLLFLEERLKEEKLLSDLNADREELKRYDTMVELELTEENNNENNNEQ